MIEVPELALPRFNDTALALLAWENAAPDGAQSPRETDGTVWMSQGLALNAERAVTTRNGDGTPVSISPRTVAGSLASARDDAAMPLRGKAAEPKPHWAARGEPIVVELELENPLAVVIEVTELQLVAEMDRSQVVLPVECTCFHRPCANRTSLFFSRRSTAAHSHPSRSTATTRFRRLGNLSARRQRTARQITFLLREGRSTRRSHLRTAVSVRRQPPSRSTA